MNLDLKKIKLSRARYEEFFREIQINSYRAFEVIENLKQKFRSNCSVESPGSFIPRDRGQVKGSNPEIPRRVGEYAGL